MNDDFGLSNKGFRRKTYNDVLEEMQTRVRELFGEDVNVSSRSLLGMLLMVISWTVSLLWQLAENVYYSAYIGDAEGVNLDRLANNIGVIREGKRHASGYVEVTADKGTVLEAGFIVANGRGVEYRTDREYVVDKAKFPILVVSVEKGKDTNSDVGEITDIITPVAGVDSVYNSQEVIGGKDEETDDEFRARYFDSLSKAGASTVNSIASSIRTLDGVKSAIVEENTTSEVDSYGRPPHCIQAYVVGGNAKDIGYAIFETKAGGIQAYGDTKVTVQDISGKDREVAFSYAKEKKVNVEVEILKDESFHRNGEVFVKDTLTRFIGGIDSNGVERSGLQIGEDVIISQIVRELWQIEGIVDVNVKIGFGAVSNKNLTIDFTEVATIGEVEIKYV